MEKKYCNMSSTRTFVAQPLVIFRLMFITTAFFSGPPEGFGLNLMESNVNINDPRSQFFEKKKVLSGKQV